MRICKPQPQFYTYSHNLTIFPPVVAALEAVVLHPIMDYIRSHQAAIA